jgi:signal transduction histidine kinase
MTTTLPKGRILFVDDEPALLAGLERSLRPTRQSWQCEFLTDPLAALDRIETTPFEVIVSDMRMPGMSGAEFLARACQVAPDSVRMMLTGNHDLQTAMDAVNCGHVFQFVLKPCEGERLIEHLASAIYQQRLQLAEREVLRLKLEQADKMVVVGKLAAGITHDLKNILGAILIQAELNLMQEPESAESSGLKLIHEAAKRAAELTREINNLSRTDERPLLQRVDPAEVVGGGVRITQPLLGRKIKVTIQPAGPLPEILADAGRLKQALLNLLINARDAMPSGGNISIATTVCQLSAATATAPGARAGKFICLSVTDTGHGMDEATLQRIQQPFFTTKPSGQGVGLGLFMIKRALAEHDGWMEIKSTPGQGTSFQLFLPVPGNPEPKASS